MKNYTVTYTKGHLVDTDSGKRILLKSGGKFNLSGKDDQFEEKKDLSVKINPLTSKDKLKRIEGKYKRYTTKKIAQRGDILIYRIGIGFSKKTNEDNSHEFLFEAILLEDLYMKTKISNTGQLRVTLCECLCETSNCIDGDMQLYETIKGNSLANLFSNMVAFYFPMQRSGACNAFKTFFIPKCKGHKLNDVKFKNLPNLDWRRAQLKQTTTK